MWLYECFKWLSWIGGYGFLIALIGGAAFVFYGAQYSSNPYGGIAQLIFVLPALAVLFILFLIGVIGRWLI